MNQPFTYSFWPFYRLGIEHILSGYDHLVFLLGLLLAFQRPRSILLVITAFTLAHSLSLTLATLGLVRVPGTVVEPLIALTIIAVGVENFFRGEFGWVRACSAFAFGLIHGLGFASVLLDLGVRPVASAIFWPLMTFNLGVETGQLIVAPMILLLLFIARKSPWFRAYGNQSIAGGIILIGTYWLIERLISA